MKRAVELSKADISGRAAGNPKFYPPGSNMAQLVGENCLCLALRQATRRVSRLYDEALAPYGLTIGQLGILAMITSMSAGDDDPSVQELADAFDMDQSAMSRTLRPLIREGLVTDHTSTQDRRRRTLVVTEKGRDRMEIASDAWAAMQCRLIETLESSEAEALLTILNRFGRFD